MGCRFAAGAHHLPHARRPLARAQAPLSGAPASRSPPTACTRAGQRWRRRERPGPDGRGGGGGVGGRGGVAHPAACRRRVTDRRRGRRRRQYLDCWPCGTEHTTGAWKVHCHPPVDRAHQWSSPDVRIGHVLRHGHHTEVQAAPCSAWPPRPSVPVPTHRSQRPQSTAQATTASTNRSRYNDARASWPTAGRCDGARCGERAGAAAPRASARTTKRTALVCKGHRGWRPPHCRTLPGHWGQGQHVPPTDHGSGRSSRSALAGCGDVVQPVERIGPAVPVDSVSGTAYGCYSWGLGVTATAGPVIHATTSVSVLYQSLHCLCLLYRHLLPVRVFGDRLAHPPLRAVPPIALNTQPPPLHIALTPLTNGQAAQHLLQHTRARVVRQW